MKLKCDWTTCFSLLCSRLAGLQVEMTQGSNFWQSTSVIFLSLRADSSHQPTTLAFFSHGKRQRFFYTVILNRTWGGEECVLPRFSLNGVKGWQITCNIFTSRWKKPSEVKAVIQRKKWTELLFNLHLLGSDFCGLKQQSLSGCHFMGLFDCFVTIADGANNNSSITAFCWICFLYN